MLPPEIIASEIESFIRDALDGLRALPAGLTQDQVTGQVSAYAAMVFKAAAILTRSVEAAEAAEATFLDGVRALDRERTAANSNAFSPA